MVWENYYLNKAKKDSYFLQLRQKNIIHKTTGITISFDITSNFVEAITDCHNKFGVYFISDNKGVKYVGRSKKLDRRILQSIKERVGNNPVEQWYLQYIITNTESDSALLEIYFVSHFKPELNGDITPKDDLTIAVKYLVPLPSNPIPINILHE